VTPPSRRREDERGAAATALLVTAVLVGLTVFVFLAVPYGAAVDAKARNRTAADAAALAGATGARDTLLGSIGPRGVPHWGDLPSAAGLGYAKAEEYAARNGGQLVAYHFDTVDGTAHATVEGLDAEDRVARSSAVAQVELPRCTPLDLPEPPEPREPADPPGPPGDDDEEDGRGGGRPEDRGPRETGPPPPVDVTVDCGPVRLTFVVELDEDGAAEVTFPPGQTEAIKDVMHVRLVE
jgi:hypothetical protein